MLFRGATLVLGLSACALASPLTLDSSESGHESTSLIKRGTFVVAQYMQSLTQVSQTFSSCSQVASSSSSYTVIYQEIQTLYTQVSTLVQQYSVCSDCATFGQQYSVQFQQTITTCFQQFQTVVQVCKERYASQWDTVFAPLVQKFQPFFQHTATNCRNFGVDYGSIISGINVNLFNSVGLNINIRVGNLLNINIGGNGNGNGGLLGPGRGLLGL